METSSSQCENKILAATSYGSPVIKKAIRALKYQKAKRVAKPLAKLIHTRLMNEVQPHSLIIPIPLSKKRLRERGFNQAELIAKELSDIMSIKVLTYVLRRDRHTISQVDIKDRKKRLNNLKNAFSVKNKHLIQGVDIFVIDDVSTTGATINEACRVLKLAGAKSVTGVVVARG
ncbi:MAG: ComF family protein [Patescibacteria group bacterium]